MVRNKKYYCLWYNHGQSHFTDWQNEEGSFLKNPDFPFPTSFMLHQSYNESIRLRWSSSWFCDWLTLFWQKNILTCLKLSGVLELWLALAITLLRCSCSHVWKREAQRTYVLKSTAAALLQMNESWICAPNLEEFLDTCLLLRNP